MTPSDLDLITDVVEQTTDYLRTNGMIKSDRGEFLVSRFLEWGIRGKTVTEASVILGVSRRNTASEFRSMGLPPPSEFLDLGAAVCVARSCNEMDRKLVDTCRFFRMDVHRAGGALERQFGIRYRGLRGKAWQELLGRYLSRKSSADGAPDDPQ